MISRSGNREVEFPLYKSNFINVPAGTQAMIIETGVSAGRLKPRYLTTTGQVVEAFYSLTDTRMVPYQTGGSFERTILRPEPGVWEVVLENDDLFPRIQRNALSMRGAYDMKIMVLGVNVADLKSQTTSTKQGGDPSQSIMLSNNFAAFSGGLIETPLASAYSESPVLRENGPPQIYDIDVPSGAANLEAFIRSPEDPEADADLYLYDCTGGKCALKDASTGPGTSEKVSISNPQGGKWKVVLDPVRTPKGGLNLLFEDYYTHTALGRLIPVENPNGEHGNGSRWNVSVNARVTAVPTAPRRLAGIIMLVDEQPTTVAYKRDREAIKTEPVKARIALGTAIIDLDARLPDR